MYIGEVMFIGECGTQDYNLKYQKGQNQKPGRRKVLANHLVISTTYAAIGVKTKRTKTAKKALPSKVTSYRAKNILGNGLRE